MKWGIMVMKSTTSIFNKGILQNDLRRFFWLGIIYLLGMLAAVPLQIFMIFNRSDQSTLNGLPTYLRVLDGSSSFQFLLLVVMPVLTGLLLFRYLQVSKSSDMEHALPIKRAALFNTHILSGNILLLTPLIVTALVTWLTVAGLGLESVNTRAILTWLGTSLLFNLLFFMTTAAVGIFTGMTALQGVLTYILLLLPTGLSILLLQNLNMFIYGFAYDHYYSSSVKSLSPLLRLESAFSHPLPAGMVTLYLLLIAALHILGRYMYQQRPLEKVGNAVVFEVLGQVLKYGVVFCVMLLAGGYFYDAQGSISWVYFGYLLGSLLAYILMEVLLDKSLNIFQWRRFKGYGFYALLIILLVTILNFDVMGYEKRGPELSEVQSIYMDYSFFALDNRNAILAQSVYDPQSAYPYDSYEYKRVLPVYTDPDNLADIYALHQAIIKDSGKSRPVKRGYNPDREQLCLAYELKDGSRLYRQYSIKSKDYAAQLKPIYESPEYKKLHYDILRINPHEAKLIEIDTREGNKQLRISRPELIEQAILALQEDTYQQSYTEMTSRKSSWAQVSIYLDKRQVMYATWPKSFTHFENWLIENEMYDQARLLPDEDIKYALAGKISASKPVPHWEKNALNIEEFAQSPGVITIQEAAELEQCLRSYYYPSNEPSAYFIVFLLKNDRILEGVFPEADTPDFIKERLK